MNKAYWSSVFIVVAPAVLADGAGFDASTIQWAGGVSAGYTRLDFPQKLDSEPTFASAIVFGAASYDRFYATLSYADSLADEKISEEEDIGDASRQDIDLSLGYRLTDNWSLFVGYKDSETDVDFVSREGGFKRDESYQQDGFFLGASYSIDFASAGTLSLNVAYAELDSDNRFAADIEDEDEEGEDSEEGRPEFDDLSGSVSGDVDGLSYGISWQMPLGEEMAFSANFKVNDYEETVRVGGVGYSVDQTITFFNIGLVKIF